MNVLNKAAGYFRYHLAQAIDLRVTPELSFVYDESITRGNRVSALIDKVLARQAPQQDQDSQEEEE